MSGFILLIRNHALINNYCIICFKINLEVKILKKIIVALLVLSVALIGIGFVAAASDVDNVHGYGDNGHGLNPEPHFGPCLPHDDPSRPYINPNPFDQHFPQPGHQF